MRRAHVGGGWYRDPTGRHDTALVALGIVSAFVAFAVAWSEPGPRVGDGAGSLVLLVTGLVLIVVGAIRWLLFAVVRHRAAGHATGASDLHPVGREPGCRRVEPDYCVSLQRTARAPARDPGSGIRACGGTR